MSKKMKKFWSLMLVALVTLGAAACSEKDENVDTKQEATVSFYAEIADDTRATLDKEGDVWKTSFEEGDKLMVNGFEFIHNGTKFVCNAEGVQNIIGTNVTITGDFGDSTTGKNAVKIEDKIVEDFKSGSTVTLDSQLSFFMFNYNGELTLTADKAIFKAKDANEVAATELTLTAEGETFVAFYPNGNNTTISYSIDDVTQKETTINFAKAKVYNLGNLTPKTTVYLVPGVWASDGPNFSVYYWDGDFNDEVIMTKDETKNGVYMAEIYENADGLIFKRLNPADNTEWNKTGDLTLPTDNKNHYYITGWGETDGEWREYVRTEWSVSGTFNTWGDTAMTRINATMSVAQNIALTAYSSQFKIKDVTTWDTNYGAGFGYMLPGHYMTATYNGGEIVVTETGTYDIYFNEADTIIYVVAAGADYTTAVEQTENGPAPVTGNIYYFKPNSNWTAANAKFSGYFWNGAGNKWAELTDEDADGIYECNLGEWTPTKVIFLRKDPTGFVYNNWTCWNRIGDITVPTGKNFYTMASGTWTEEIGSGDGYTGGTWGTK